MPYPLSYGTAIYSSKLCGGLPRFGLLSSCASTRRPLGVTTAVDPTKKSSPSASNVFAVASSSSSSRVALPSAAIFSRRCRLRSISVAILP
jgi:hypothetical protein